MKKNKIITSVIVMALCSFAIAYATNKSGIIVFILSWIVGIVSVGLKSPFRVGLI